MTTRARGIGAALAAAALFGVSTPLAKALLGAMDPWMLAGLLYSGSGIGLALVPLLRRSPRAALEPGEWPWLAGAIALGGVAAPALLMLGLARVPASSAALLLNAEGVMTALLAWFVFRENFDRRVALGMACIVGGAILLSLPEGPARGPGLAAPLILAACLCWAIDNNLTRRVSLSDPVTLAAIKGLVAGPVNVALALLAGAHLPPWPAALGAGVVGLCGYGISLVLFVVALRELGTARTGAYFSLAPFVGACVATLLLGEPVTARLVAAGLLMGLGAWLHVSEHHEHEHHHERLEHSHEHVHDEHHQHEHDGPFEEPHVHPHVHEPLVHRHPHFPDAHHRHEH